MFNNSETYGSDEAPNNMVSSTNRSLSSSNVNHNLNSFGKISQQASSSASGQYEGYNFPNFGTPPIGIPPYIPRFQGYDTMGHPSPYLPHNSAFLHDSASQDYFPVVSTTSQVEHHNNSLNFHQNFNLKALSELPPTSNIELNIIKNYPLNIPHVPTKINPRSSNIDNYSNNSQNHSQSCATDDSKPDKPAEVILNLENLNKSDMESTKSLGHSNKTSLENICSKIFENIPATKSSNIDKTDIKHPTNLSDHNTDSSQNKPETPTPVIQQTSFDEKNIPSISVYHNQNMASPMNKFISERKRKSLEKTVRLIESILIKSTNNNLKSENSDSTMEDPLAFSPKPKNQTEDEKMDSDDEALIKKVPKKNRKRKAAMRISPSKKIKSTRRSHVIEIETDVQIDHQMKVEQDGVKVKDEHSAWPDKDYANPFQRDSNGVPRSDLEDVMIISTENSVEEALASIKNGSKSQGYFQCPHCSLLVHNPKKFLIHTKWHKFGLLNDKRAEIAREKEKKRELRTMQRLSEVDRTGGEDEQNFPCKDCDKMFHTRSGLKAHRRTHMAEVTECRVCGDPVSDARALRAHMTCHEDKDAGAYQCPRCPKHFKYRHSLAKHADTHLEKTHACPECSKMFGSALLVRLHMKTHERMARGTTYHCSYCAKGFYEPYNLSVHERTHRNDKPYKCDICDSSFVTNSSLKRHVKVSHSGAKPHTCDVCHKCFSTEAIRDRHVLRVHTDQGLFPHQCELCPRRYMKPKDLRSHVYKMHLKEKKKSITEVDSASS